MIIPDGVNQFEFYKKAKAKGITIRSRFKGVYVAFHGFKARHVGWRAHLNSRKTDKQYQKIFLFTPEGELAASKEYLKFVEQDRLLKLQKQLNPPI